MISVATRGVFPAARDENRTAAVILKEKVVLKSLDVVDETVKHPSAEGWTKHMPNGREANETAMGWDSRTHQETSQGRDPRT